MAQRALDQIRDRRGEADRHRRQADAVRRLIPKARMRVLRPLWRLLRALLLGLAALVVFIEEFGWRPLSAWLGRTPGYVKRLLPGTWTWAVGLGNDELGYILPLSDYRVLCVADKLGGAGACARLHQAGLIDFPDAV